MVSTFVEALHAYHRAVFWETEKLGVHNQGRLMSGWSVMDANLVDEIQHLENSAFSKNQLELQTEAISWI